MNAFSSVSMYQDYSCSFCLIFLSCHSFSSPFPMSHISSSSPPFPTSHIFSLSILLSSPFSQFDLEGILPTMVLTGAEDENPHEATGRGKYARKREEPSYECSAENAADEEKSSHPSRRHNFYNPVEASYAPRDKEGRVSSGSCVCLYVCVSGAEMYFHYYRCCCCNRYVLSLLLLFCC